MWLITGRFTICGYETRELDLTPTLAILLIGIVAYCLMFQTPVGG